MSERTPTLEDVARAAGVSRATVSRVVNGIRNVDPQIQERVRAAVAATGYSPNRAARSLATRRANSVALVVSGPGEDACTSRVFADPFFGRIAGGIVLSLRREGIHPVLMLADTDEARDDVLTGLRRGDADGALLVSTHVHDPLPAMLAGAGVPAVLFSRPVRPVEISYVEVDNHAGAALAADHLLARGRERLATITGPAGVPVSQDRLTGFREALARHGLHRVPVAEGDFTQDGGEAAMLALLAEHPGLDGVFAANDLMAQGAIAVLRDHGRAVPDDVAVIGFDDGAPAQSSRPRLTTIRQPVEDMAAEMATLLLTRLAAPATPPTSVIFAPTLIPRAST
ncbi:LacI family DNA-binding transcriptional regulator [Allokutzneria oryzae]|uniref:LacI family DNA-binding transcriptional regulator n=1 Tax=Allokutzneria oryzae TaxID=1378989 RepID=A0ABV5ZQI1_9PSEU